MQRNWIGRSVGAEVDFEIAKSPKTAIAAAAPPVEELADDLITVFTTRPDTLYGATYLVLAPEHALVDSITTAEQREAVNAYRAQAANKSERERQQDAKEKTGVFTGAYAINPVNDEQVPVWVADYVLTGYGTGAIMAVPAGDQRDYDFAAKFGLPIKNIVRPVHGELPAGRAFSDYGIAVGGVIDGLPSAEAKQHIIDLLEREGTGKRTINYKLRDWLFSRQRYWGEPFPIVLDNANNHYGLTDAELPVTLPQMEDFKPTGTPEPPLSKVKDWLHYTGPAVVQDRTYTRETNTMPQWAGSCWYYLRYIDPNNAQAPVDEVKERYWMPVDLYVGGVEHAVLHLLYARFWHKVLFDLGHVSTAEPFQRLVNQGLILGPNELHFFESTKGPVSVTEVVGIDERSPGKRAAEDVRLPQNHRRKADGHSSDRDADGKERRQNRSESEQRHRRRCPQFQDEQEPRERGEPRRNRRGIRGRLLPPVRDVHGSARSTEAVEHTRHRRHVAVPQRRVAEPHG